jgi:hypothetical protein
MRTNLIDSVFRSQFSIRPLALAAKRGKGSREIHLFAAYCAGFETKGNSTMKTLIFLLGVGVPLGLAGCAGEPTTTTTTTTRETTTLAPTVTPTQQTTTQQAMGGGYGGHH